MPVDLQQAAKCHLWLHFTRHGGFAEHDVPIMVRGEGVHLFDDRGRRYLDGLSGLFVSQLGHSRTDLADAAARQARELAFLPLWSYAQAEGPDTVAAVFLEPVQNAGYTFGGHPVATAVALANLDAFEAEGTNAHVRATQGAFRATLEQLLDLPIVGDVRGDGYFYGIELVKDKATKETFTGEEAEVLLRGNLSPALLDAGLYCRPTTVATRSSSCRRR